MQKNFYFSLFVLLLVALVLPCQQVLAQTQIASDTTNSISGDTLWVAWQKTGSSWGTVRTNALRSAILADTGATASEQANANRIYGLKNGGYYWESDDIAFSGFTLRIVGASFADENFPNGRTAPPMLQMTDTKDDGSAGAAHLITASSSLTLKNLYISGCTNVNGVQTAYQPITFPANNSTFIVDNCILTRSNFSLVVITGAGNTVSVTNCKFRNLIESPPTQQWTGRGVSIWADQESVIIENNTFFNLGFATFQMENGSAKYLRYNHNTLVNIGRCVMSGSGDWWQSAYFTNNLLVNVYWEGEGYSDMHQAGRDARNVYDGYFHIATLPSSYGTQETRRVVIAKNAAYVDPLVLGKYGTGSGADTITRAWFMDPVSKLDYAIPYSLGSGNGHMYVADTTWLTSMPTGMTDYLRDVDWRKPQANLTGATMIDSMYEFITQVRIGTGISTVFFYRPTLSNGDRQWPLPENFTYTKTSELTGTDGLPLGDLNWFPTDKATFLTDQVNFVKQIESLAGQVVIDSIKDKIEAEDGVLGGTSAQAKNEGTIYWNYNQLGTLTWTFDVPAGKAGIYSTKWLVNMDGQGGSQGMVLHMNDNQINDKALGWGAMPFSVDPEGTPQVPESGLPANDWTWVTLDSVECTSVVAFTTTEGTNTIGVKGGGWNHLLFAEVDLAPMGSVIDDTIKCKGVDVVPAGGDIASGAIGLPWVASKFKYVELGTAGTITMSTTADRAGTYKLRIFGQNVSGSDAALTIREGSTTLASPVLPFKLDGAVPDDKGNDAVTSTFSLSAGAHSLELSGANVNIDYIQLIKQDILAGVNGQNLIPNSFVLEQNYPNPFNPSTTINFTLGKASNVKLTVYNLLGQRVATLVDGRMNAGTQSVVFDASRFASGVYFYRLDAGSNFNSVKKMLLLK
jgi:hypothetical protein